MIDKRAYRAYIMQLYLNINAELLCRQDTAVRVICENETTTLLTMHNASLIGAMSSTHASDAIHFFLDSCTFRPCR